MCGRSEWFFFWGSTSLTIHGELNHIIVASHHMFSPIDWLTWVNDGGGWLQRPIPSDFDLIFTQGYTEGLISLFYK